MTIADTVNHLQGIVDVAAWRFAGRAEQGSGVENCCQWRLTVDPTPAKAVEAVTCSFARFGGKKKPPTGSEEVVLREKTETKKDDKSFHSTYPKLLASSSSHTKLPAFLRVHG